MSETRVPAIPAPTDANLREVARAIKGVLDVREGLIGDPLDSNVTFRDLQDGGVISVSTVKRGGGSASIVVAPAGADDGYDPIEDLTPPPQPTGFTATGAFASVILSWTAPNYPNHALTEIWRASPTFTGTPPNQTEVSPVIGNAVRVATTDTNLYADYIGNSGVRYYWIRFRSQADVAGPYNATNGTRAETSPDPGLLLDLLTGEITESQLYEDLSDRIDLIDDPTTGLVKKVGDLETTYGSTASAATSAAAAAQSASDAVTARTAAQLAETGAVTAKDAAVVAKTAAETAQSSASTSASQASNSATSASGSASSASTSASNAANSATAAGNSASAAATSASNANTYATNAETASTAATIAKVAAESARDAASGSATAAASSASTATTKATEAGQSATAAASSATQAATSESNALTYRNEASSSASTATTKAAEASTSAGAAATSATNASNSASAASTSANTASTKATEASQSATSASTSATTASTQASQAGVYATNAATSASNAAGSASSAASALTQIQASNATALAAVQTLATTVAGPDGATAQYTIKTDTNGYVSGFGLSSTSNAAGTGTSSFAVRADQFYIANPSGPSVAPAMPFIVRTTPTTINGVSVPAGVYISDAFIQNGTITRAKIGDAAIDRAKIADGEITTAKIGDAQITNAKIDSLDAGKITAGTISADRIGAGSIAATKLNVTDLSSITANVGTLTAGLIRNSADSFRVDVTNGRTIATTGSYMKVTGAPFGSSNQFIEWYGPYQSSLSNCTEANATYYLKTNGAAYFGGALSAGTLTNKGATSDLGVSAEIVVGPFGTNGNTKTVTLSYVFSGYWVEYQNSSFGSSSGTTSATVKLYRKIGSGSEAEVATLNVSGTWSWYIDPEPFPGPVYAKYWTQDMSGSVTYTDNVSGTDNRTYRAQITSRSIGFGTMAGTYSQRVEIVSIE